jgi:hypothetical protein
VFMNGRHNDCATMIFKIAFGQHSSCGREGPKIWKNLGLGLLRKWWNDPRVRSSSIWATIGSTKCKVTNVVKRDQADAVQQYG